MTLQRDARFGNACGDRTRLAGGRWAGSGRGCCHICWRWHRRKFNAELLEFIAQAPNNGWIRNSKRLDRRGGLQVWLGCDHSGDLVEVFLVVETAAFGAAAACGVNGHINDLAMGDSALTSLLE